MAVSLPTRRETLVVALAGNPNCGKTTLFNALTGLSQKVANYPGVTVEKKVGKCTLADGSKVAVIDLPGAYSLISRSPDERVTMEVLRGLRSDTPPPDVVIAVVDASNLQRNLYLVSQLVELGRPLVVALNMTDIAERRGVSVDAAKLSAQLGGVPVVPLIGHKKDGIGELKAAIKEAKIAPLPAFRLPAEMVLALDAVDGVLTSEAHALGGRMRLLDVDSSSPLPTHRAIAERMLIGDLTSELDSLLKREPIKVALEAAHDRLTRMGIDPMQADIEAHYAWIDEVATAASSFSGTGFQPVQAQPFSETIDPPTADQIAEHGLKTHATKRQSQTTLDYRSAHATLTDRLDRVFLHRVWGLAIFAVLMAGLFVLMFWLASPLMDGLQKGVTWLGGLVTSHIPEGALHDLWTDGVVAGVGSVVVFVPQIAILFLFLAILEDTGYLARAAFLMDRLLGKLGLHGKAFIPLLSSFACAIPGIMATRTIESRRDRLATIFVAPFMSCSARLPVYALLIGTFFAAFGGVVKGLILLSLYVLGILAAVATAWLFKRTLLKGAPTSFILELPTYKLPQAGQVARVVWTNTKAFVVRAGTVIFCLSVVLWALTYWPRLTPVQVANATSHATLRFNEFENANDITWKSAAGGLSGIIRGVLPSNSRFPDVMPARVILQMPVVDVQTNEDPRSLFVDEQLAALQLRHSYAGRFGHLIEPAIKPLGFDWKMGVGLVSAFAAREVFVSTMGIVYSAGDTEADTQPLSEAIKADRTADGKPVWTPLVAASLLVWFVIAMQCMSTLAIVRRETRSWAWPIGMLMYMNGLAYVLCLCVYQVGRIWFA